MAPSTNTQRIPPASMAPQLSPYQREGVEILLRNARTRNMLLADSPGLGKTAQLLSFTDAADLFPLVVICPASLVLNWQREALLWCPSISIDRIFISCDKTTSLNHRHKIAIFSYEQAVTHAASIAELHPECIAFDEAHALKNHRSIRFSILEPLARNAPVVVPMTGTPIPNRVEELYSMLQLIRFPQLETRSEFRRKYGKKAKPEDLNELHTRISSHTIRRRKHEVLKDLPSLSRSMVAVTGCQSIDGDRPLRDAISGALAESGYDVDRALSYLRDRSRALSVLGLLLAEYRRLGLSKVAAAIDMARNTASIDDPLIVFAHHKDVIDPICRSLDSAGLPHATITGRVSAGDRQQAVDDMQSGKLAAIVLSIGAAATGLTLTRAHRMLVAELPWSPQTAIQCEGRALRIGQALPVSVQYLVAAGSMDERIWRLLETKTTVANTVIDGDPDSIPFDAVTEHATSIHWQILREMLQESIQHRNVA